MDLAIAGRSEDRIEITFEQQYRASNYRDTTRKRLLLERAGGGWRITEEVSL
ncbi:MAG: hypothetical protein VX766_12270 [Pseudomonadota bacterium]|nr:hypothetical protein [Pseudomonadota bacterium]